MVVSGVPERAWTDDATGIRWQAGRAVGPVSAVAGRFALDVWPGETVVEPKLRYDGAPIPLVSLGFGSGGGW